MSNVYRAAMGMYTVIATLTGAGVTWVLTGEIETAGKLSLLNFL